MLVLLVAALLLVALVMLPRGPARGPRMSTSAVAVGRVVRLIVLVDNHPYRRGVATAWGLAVLVEAGGRMVLFDTGPSPGLLESNAAVIGVNLSRVGVVVLSHRHLDHCGGLPALPRSATVYVPPDDWLEAYVERLGFKRLVVVNETMMAAPGVYVLKPLYGPPWEEALAVETGKGLVVVTGCAHPGVVGFVREALRLGRVYMVIGGFHLAGAPRRVVERLVDQLLELGVEKIAPIHCSGEEIIRILEEEHPGVLVRAGAGFELTLPAPTS